MRKLDNHLLVYKRVDFDVNGETLQMQAVIDGYKEGLSKHLSAAIYVYKHGVPYNPQSANNSQKIVFKSMP